MATNTSMFYSRPREKLIFPTSKCLNMNLMQRISHIPSRRFYFFNCQSLYMNKPILDFTKRPNKLKQFPLKIFNFNNEVDKRYSQYYNNQRKNETIPYFSNHYDWQQHIKVYSKIYSSNSFTNIFKPIQIAINLPTYSNDKVQSSYYYNQSLRSFSSLKTHNKKENLKSLGLVSNFFKQVFVKSIKFTKLFLVSFKELIVNPKIAIVWYNSAKESLSHFLIWSYTGIKLFCANVRVSYHLVRKKILGYPLQLREHKLLVRTSTDALKLIPFSLFLIIPFAEFLLPIALRLFPKMLPSTFFEKQYDSGHLQRKLKAKKELAIFFQELMHERTRQILDVTPEEYVRDKAKLLDEFQAKIIQKDDFDVNPFLSLKELLTFAKLFKKEFVMEKMSLETLQVICKLLGVEPHGRLSHLVLKLRHHMINIQKEDREILWEGVENLTHIELIEACKARAMRFYDISDEAMRDQMSQWLTLSMHKDIPSILLIWSRCITITHTPLEAPLTSVQQNVEQVNENIESESLKSLQENELAEAEKRVEELKLEAEELKNSIEKMQSHKISEKNKDASIINEEIIEKNKASEQDDTYIEEDALASVKLEKEKLFVYIEILNKEIKLLRSISDLQQEQLVRASQALTYITPLIETDTSLKNNKSNPDLKVLLKEFEEGMKQVEILLTNAKNNHHEDQMAINYLIDFGSNLSEDVQSPSKLTPVFPPKNNNQLLNSP